MLNKIEQAIALARQLDDLLEDIEMNTRGLDEALGSIEDYVIPELNALKERLEDEAPETICIPHTFFRAVDAQDMRGAL